jgi:hypothetical protein
MVIGGDDFIRDKLTLTTVPFFFSIGMKKKKQLRGASVGWDKGLAIIRHRENLCACLLVTSAWADGPVHLAGVTACRMK